MLLKPEGRFPSCDCCCETYVEGDIQNELVLNWSKHSDCRKGRWAILARTLKVCFPGTCQVDSLHFLQGRFYLIALWWVVFFMYLTHIWIEYCVCICTDCSVYLEVLWSLHRSVEEKHCHQICLLLILFLESLYFFYLNVICDRCVCGFFFRVREVWCNLKSFSFCKFVYCK